MDEKLAAMRSEGKTFQEIADAIGKTPKAVEFRTYNLGIQKQGRQHLYDQRIIEMRAEGYTHQDIADTLQITRQAVAKRIQKLKCPKANIKPIPRRLRFVPDPELLELAEGHVAADARSYEILMEMKR